MKSCRYMNIVNLSIIVPVYNAMPFLKRTLDSIFSQTTKYKYEVILVDDGSTDDSVDYITSRTEENLVFIQQKNAGPSKARNVGVQYAHGEYVAFLDADDYWLDGFIQKTLDFLKNNDECVAVSVGQKHLAIQGEIIKPACINEMPKPIVLEDFWNFWILHSHICTGSATIRTNVLKEIGGQREDLRVTEDLELWALLATYGKWGFIPKILFIANGADTIINQSDWLKRMQIRWSNAPSIEDWEKRIIKRVNQTEAYKKARGRIARNLVYCQLLSGRESLARREAKLYGRYFTKDAIGKLMNFAKWSQLTWWLLCKFLKYREWHRK